MNRKRFSRALSLLLLCALLLQSGGAAVAPSDPDTIYLGDANDLLEFAENCAYDAWSVGKTVILQRDVALGGVDFAPIASFGGVFDGRGHTISGLSITGNVSPAGLFGTVAAGGVVQNLNVDGSVSPAGSADAAGGVVGVNHGTLVSCAFTGTVNGESRVGGIAGENAADGTLRRCSVNGGVFGKNMTGGVAGVNHGAVSFCVNRAFVNTNTIDPSVSFDKLDLSLPNGLASLTSPDTFNVTVDSGGIAGFSDGALLGCHNYGSVGYQHVGYNVGGVAGRSSGHLASCINEGSVYGRREVGGVVGMAEPYVRLDLKLSSIEQVRNELSSLSAMIDRTVNDAEGGTQTISARLSETGRSVNEAVDNARTLTNQLTDYWDGTISEINRGSEIVDVVIPQLYTVSQDLTGVTVTLTDALDELERALDGLNLPGGINGKAFAALSQMAQELRTGTQILDAGTRQVQNGLKTLEGTVSPKEGMSEEAWRDLIYGPVNAETGKRSGGALGEVGDGLRESVSAMSTLTGVLSELATAVSNGEINSVTELQQFFDEHSGAADALQKMSAGFEKASKGLDTIAENTEVRPENLSDGLAGVRAGLGTMTGGRSGDKGGAFYYFGAALDSLSRASAEASRDMDALGNAMDDAEAPLEHLRSAAGGFRDASNGMTTTLGDMNRLLDYLRAQDRLSFETLGEETDASANALYDSVRGISDNLELLNQEAKDASNRVLEDVREINRRFTSLMNTLLDVLTDMEDASVTRVVEDTSDEDVDSVVNGKVLLCSNSGTVSGDIDVGGVAGAMMIYNELDPENDNDTIASTFHKRYELKCILQDCVNTGAISGRKDNVGSVCGSATLGVVSGCEAYGSAESEGGEHVGGIAGYANNIVRKCWSKCTLTGPKYIGGIVGYGKDEGSSLRVESCRALVEVTGDGQYTGSIMGAETGTLSGNLFVSGTLAGVNRISEQGKSEPVSYDRLLGEEGLPSEFRKFTLRFVAGEETVSEREFFYGESLDDSAFPDIPPVEGSYAHWDRDDLRDLRFDTTVTAVYEPCVTALSSTITRSAARPTFFLQGAFDNEAALAASPAIFDFDDGQDDLLHRLRSYRRTLLEQWQLTLPDDGAASHTVRYLPPEGTWGHLELYTFDGTRWNRLDTGAMGSYLTFEAEGDSVELTVVSTATPWWVWALAGGFVVAAALLLLALLIRRKPQPVLTPEERAKAAAHRKKHRAIRVALVAAALALGGATTAVVLLAPGLTDSMGLYMLLRNYAERTDLDMAITVSANVEEQHFDANVGFFTTQCGDRRVSCVMWQDIPLYYCDGTMLLENGRAYKAESLLPDFSKLFGHAAGLFRAVDIAVEETNGIKTYRATAQGDTARQILRALLPEAMVSLSEADTVELQLVLTDGEPTSLRFRWNGANGSAEAELRRSDKEFNHTLPQAVRMAVTSGEYANAQEIGPELERLILVWTTLAMRDPLTADVTLSANCGPLLLDETLNWQRTNWNGTELSCVSRRGTRLYFTDDAACTGNGVSVELGSDSRAGASKLLHLAYEAFLLGEAECTATTTGGWRYSVVLDADAMAAFAEAIAPETQTLGSSLDEGSIRLELTGDAEASSITVQCKGTVRVVRADIPASVGAKLEFASDDEFLAPTQRVLNTLGLDPKK